jgi:hypothetical protein
VAHLIHGERFNVIYLTSLIDGYELTNDGFGGNVTAQVEATVKANPSIKLMLEELRRAVEEILHLHGIDPRGFRREQGSYYRFGSDPAAAQFPHHRAHPADKRCMIQFEIPAFEMQVSRFSVRRLGDLQLRVHFLNGNPLGDGRDDDRGFHTRFPSR